MVFGLRGVAHRAVLCEPEKERQFFRQSHNHALIWALVVRGFYTDTPPSFKDCIRTATYATETVRKIMFDAVSLGFSSWIRQPMTAGKSSYVLLNSASRNTSVMSVCFEGRGSLAFRQD